MKGTKPKLLLFINTLQSGGAERVVSLLLAHLQEDFEIHLGLYTNVIDYTIPQEIKIFDLKEPLRQNKIIRFLKLPFQAYKVYKYCKKNNIDISVSFLYRPCCINALMRSFWKYKGKVIMCERIHQTAYIKDEPYFYRVFLKWMVKVAYRKADLVLANSQDIKFDLQQNYNIKNAIQVIYNPIDIATVVAKSTEEVPFEFDKNTFYFINVSGFRKQKNHQLLLEAFALLKDLHCKLLLIGGGELDNALKQQVSNLQINDKVVFCGWDTNPFKYISHSNCFVLSSNAEGFPNVVLEALACGKPVISTDCNSGPRELLAPATDFHRKAQQDYEVGEYGILTPVNNVTALAAAMKRLYEDVELRIQLEQKAKSRAQQFDVDKIKQYFKAAFTAV